MHLMCAVLQSIIYIHHLSSNFACLFLSGETHASAPQLHFSPENDTEDSRLNTDEYWSESESEVEYRGESGTGQSKFCRWWKTQQSKVKSFTDHKYFQRGILTAILVNTLSMGIEYHNQVSICSCFLSFH